MSHETLTDDDNHDRSRKDAQGKDTFWKVLKNAEFLQKKQVDVNILCVLTKFFLCH